MAVTDGEHRLIYRAILRTVPGSAVSVMTCGNKLLSIIAAACVAITGVLLEVFMLGTLRCIKVGDVLVVYRDDADVPELEAFAAALAPDPANVVVVLGAGADRAGDEWGPVLPALAAEAGEIRLVPGAASVTSSVRLGRWLAARLERPVLAHEGGVLRAAQGALFVPPAQGSGWLRLSAAQEPSSASRRFPLPGWSCAILEVDVLTEGGAVAEPLPAGAWIRPQAGAGVDGYRQELVTRLAWSVDRVLAVLGCPGAAPVAGADVETFWRLLPAEVRAVVQFVPYGDVAVAGGQSLEQALAEWLGESVSVCAEVPWSAEEPQPLGPHNGKATLDLETGSPYPEAGSPYPEAGSPEPEIIAAASGRPSADEVSSDPEEETDQPTMPLPVLRRRQPADPDPDPTPPLPSTPSVTRLDGGSDGGATVPPPTDDTAADTEGEADVPRQQPSRRKLHRMRWTVAAAAVCLAVGLPVAVLATQSSSGQTRVLAATGPAGASVGQTIAPTGTLTPSATAASPHKTGSKVAKKVPAVEGTAAAHATPSRGKLGTSSSAHVSSPASADSSSPVWPSSGNEPAPPAAAAYEPAQQPSQQPSEQPSQQASTQPSQQASTQAAAGCGQLLAGQVLSAGSAILSCDGQFKLGMQTDGNLVLYQGGVALWASNTAGTAADEAAFGADGNLVLYTSSGSALWDSGTSGEGGSFLAVQTDGNVVIYTASGTPLWSTGTAGK
jgi:hypothetical protein